MTKKTLLALAPLFTFALGLFIGSHRDETHMLFSPFAPEIRIVYQSPPSPYAPQKYSFAIGRHWYYIGNQPMQVRGINFSSDDDGLTMEGMCAEKEPWTLVTKEQP